ncbi:MAG: helix-hairpin-helix domain-containing protein [Candidatus Azobacteroides sp.]|nr:helix-hairpin-helix domain-containing protein [Candidatus Azobacteroides sp.]
MWKDFFYFSRRERQGIVVLIALIAGVFLGKYLFTPKVSVSSGVEFELSAKSENRETVPENIKEQKVQNSYVSDRPKMYYPSRKLDQQSAEKRSYYSPSSDESRASPKQNRYPVSEKLQHGTVIEINTSDTLQLMKIPGIGASFAKRIIGYRNLLGGYYRLEQLQEVYGMYEELYEKMIPYLQTDTSKIIPISVNTASLEKLKSHPYINFYQAKAIVEIRKKKGKLDNIDELYLLEEFTEEDLERIKPYLAF